MKNRSKITILILLALGLSAVSAGCNNHSTTQTISAVLRKFNNVNTASSLSSNGLSLSVFLDSKTYQPGHPVFIDIDIRNTLSQTNKISPVDNWPHPYLGIGPCDLGYPYGIAIFQGYYTTSDFSAAIPLALWDYSVIVPCPTIIHPRATSKFVSYVFKPSSDLFNDPSDPNSLYALNMELYEAGYWTGDRPNIIHHDFEPGVYTVVAGDEWGAVVIVHFTVIE